jgi:hypothetical protein
MAVDVALPTRPKPITMSLVSKRCLTPQQTAGKSAEQVRAHDTAARAVFVPRPMQRLISNIRLRSFYSDSLTSDSMAKT